MQRAQLLAARYIGRMSRSGILLRVVLVFSLVLNGIGSSLAATTMAAIAIGSGSVSSADPAAQPEHSGCHDNTAAPHHQPASSGVHPAPETPSGHSDCCGVGLCGCACAQLSSLAAIELLFLPPGLEHEQLSDAISPSRPSPVLLHLIRPPIA